MSLSASRLAPLLAAAAALAACGREVAAPPADPGLGRACFAAHLSALPPGSQHEGFEVKGERVVVRAMTGSKVEALVCRLHPDGTVTADGP